MTGYRIIVVAPVDEVTATRIARIIKQALAPWQIETYTFTEQGFTAHWRPGADPPTMTTPPAEMEHVNYHIRVGRK